MAAIILLILAVILIYLYYLGIKWFFGYVAVDAVFLGSLLLSFAAPVLYVRACYKQFLGGVWSHIPLALAAYLVLSIHLNFEAIAVYLAMPTIGHNAQSFVSVFQVLNDLLRVLPDQTGAAVVLSHIKSIDALDPYVQYHLFCVLLKSTVLCPLLLLANGAPSTDEPGSRQPALTQYFFSRAFFDVAAIVARFIDDLSRWFKRGLGQVGGLVKGWRVIFTWPIALIGFFVLFPPLAFSAVIVVGILAFHSLVIGYVILVTFLVSLLLRFVEQFFVLARWGYAKCPHCYKKVPAPAFVCPKCNQMHTNLVPGRFGLLLRRCKCGSAYLPTLFLLGKARRLTASCPHCNNVLSIGAFARNIHLLLVGGATSGKTSLMSADLMELIGGKASPLAADFDKESDRELFEKVWKPNFDAGVASAKTQELAPPALLLRLGWRKPGSCTLYLYDPAGETFETMDTTARHTHLKYSDGAVFLVDPFSLEALRSEMSGKLEEADFDYSRQPPDKVYEELLGVLGAHAGLRRGQKFPFPLAVVVPKIDAMELEKQLGVSLERTKPRNWSSAGEEDSARVREWLRRLDGNLVRSLEQQFSKVRYFAVSSFGPGHKPGKPFRPVRVLEPLLWLHHRRTAVIRP